MEQKLESRYLRFLPAIYQRDAFFERFLLIFENLWDPLDDMAGQMHHYFDPMLAPPEMVRYLAYWLDLNLNPTWPIELKRRLVNKAMDLYQWRGTKKGLTEYLRIFTGFSPEIEEEFPGMALGKKTQLGFNTLLGTKRSYFFRVTFRVAFTDQLNRIEIEQIIEQEKPAFSQYQLIISKESQK